MFYKHVVWSQFSVRQFIEPTWHDTAAVAALRCSFLDSKNLKVLRGVAVQVKCPAREQHNHFILTKRWKQIKKKTQLPKKYYKSDSHRFGSCWYHSEFLSPSVLVSCIRLILESRKRYNDGSGTVRWALSRNICGFWKNIICCRASCKGVFAPGLGTKP